LNTMQTLLSRPFGTLPELLASYAQTRPAHPALVLGEQVLSFAQLHARVQQVAGALQRDGVRFAQPPRWLMCAPFWVRCKPV
jgi:non-ribosomal peptide synthetase component F